MQRPFAVFDIDGTIFRWQLYHELFDAFVSEAVISPDNAAQALKSRERWRSRQASYHEYEMELVHAMDAGIVGVENSRIEQIADAILQSRGQYTYRYTIELLKRLKASGHVIIAISGSYQQLVDRFAELHDIDIAVGKRHRVVKGRLTAETEEIFGRKAEILHGIVSEHDLTFTDSWAIGDSGGDIDMLQSVEHPLAFNPNETLRNTAIMSGWDIVVERKSLVYHLQKGSDGSYLLATPVES